MLVLLCHFVPREPFRGQTLTTDQFIGRFLSHVLPKGFHRIRHYGLLANGNRAETGEPDGRG